MPYASKDRAKAHLGETKPTEQNPFHVGYVWGENATARDIFFYTMVPASYHQHMHIPADAADQGKPENTTSGIEVLLRTNYSSHLVFVCSWPSSALATTSDFENLIVLCRLSFQKACSPQESNQVMSNKLALMKPCKGCAE